MLLDWDSKLTYSVSTSLLGAYLDDNLSRRPVGLEVCHAAQRSCLTTLMSAAVNRSGMVHIASSNPLLVVIAPGMHQSSSRNPHEPLLNVVMVSVF
jgi:hypothetical protein